MRVFLEFYFNIGCTSNMPDALSSTPCFCMNESTDKKASPIRIKNKCRPTNKTALPLYTRKSK